MPATWRAPRLPSSSRCIFTRAGVPLPRSGGWPEARAARHVGLYAYRVAALRQWPALPASPLEQIESLEQVRALQEELNQLRKELAAVQQADLREIT